MFSAKAKLMDCLRMHSSISSCLPSPSTVSRFTKPPASSIQCSSLAGENEGSLNYKPKYLHPLFSIAPMMDYTDNHFRSLARLLTRHAWLYTEMIVSETIVHQEKNLDRFLEFPEFQHPIVLQIGGSNVSTLAKATRLANDYGYDEINLNCGCPSDKVAGHGCFGAQLMLDPKLVGEAMSAIADNCNVPVTVKCRIGVDDAESYDELCTFIDTVSTMSPTRHFIIHARKAILKGISPAANRTVPPLKYEFVYALIRDFPHLKFTLNGGVITIGQVESALQLGAHGVMVGRASCSSPWSLLGRVDSNIYGVPGPATTRRDVLSSYQEYADSVIGKYGQGRPSLRHTVKPLLHLFHSEPGAAAWRRALDKALQDCTTFSELLERTPDVIPEHVLDAPLSPKFEEGDEQAFKLKNELPEKPSFLQCNSAVPMSAYPTQELQLVYT